MGLLDIFASKPQPPQGGLLGQQPAQPNLRDQWLRYNQDAMEQGNPRLKYEEWLKQQQAAAQQAPK